MLEYPDCKLHLVGDGDLRLEIEQLVAQLQLNEAVIFHGMQSDVHPYLQSADVFVLSSSYEGMPMTIIEAMGTGLPIVASAVGGIPDMIRDGQSSLLVQPEPEEIANAILMMLRDASLREKLGRTAREDSVRFSAEYMAREYCKVYL